MYALIIMSVATLVVFVFHERRRKDPLIDLSLLKIREYTGGIVAQLINAVAWGAVLLLLSLYFELVVGLDAFSTGLRLVPFEIAFLAIGPVSGLLSDKFGHLPFTTSGIAVTSLSLFLFSTVDMATSYVNVVAYLVLLGAGIGLFVSPNISSIMGCVPAKRRGIASALRVIFFNVGFTISLNLAVLLMTFTIPYSLVTKVISPTGVMVVSAADRTLFAESLKHTYLWLALINSVAIFPSILRGKRPVNSSHQKQTQ